MADLSPAAQAVLDVFTEDNSLHDRKHNYYNLEALAAALRAAAEFLSKEVDAPKVDGSKYNGLWHSFDYLNAIAAELEGVNG